MMKLKRVDVNAILLLFLLVVVDMSRFFSSFPVDFTLCGVIFVSVHTRWPALIGFSIGAGILKDVLCFNIVPVITVNFFLVSLLIFTLKRRFKERKLFDYFIALIAVSVYLLLTAFSENKISLGFSIKFILVSWLFFIFLDYLVTRWIPGFFRE